MPNKKSIISVAISSAFAAALVNGSVASATDNPFVMQSLDKTYLLAYADRADATKSPGEKASEDKYGMSMVDKNKDGKVSREEFIKHHEVIFDKIDVNKDGFVDKGEADRYAAGIKSVGTPPSGPSPHGEMKK